MAITPRPNPETVQALLDTTWRAAAAEDSRTDELDRKAGSLATFASLVVSLTAMLGVDLVETFDRPWVFFPYASALLCLVASVGLAVRVLLPKEHVTLGMAYLRRFPKWSELLKPPEQVRGQTMATLIEAIARERRLNRDKARDVNRAFVLLLAGLVFVVVHLSILGVRAMAGVP